MLSSVLNSERAVVVNMEIMRAFVRFRSFLASNAELAAKILDLERQFESKLGDQDQRLRMLFEALRQLRDEVRKQLPPSPAKRRRIGFVVEEDNGEDEEKPTSRSKESKRTK